MKDRWVENTGKPYAECSMDFRCRVCGYTFQLAWDTDDPLPVAAVVCPRCFGTGSADIWERQEDTP